MKPYIIYIDEKKLEDGKIIINQEDFEKIISEVYQQGYDDGQKNNIIAPITPYPTWIPDPITNPPNWYTTTPDPNPWWKQPYCTTASTKDNPDNIVTSVWNDKDTAPSSSITYSTTGEDSWITINANKYSDVVGNTSHTADMKK